MNILIVSDHYPPYGKGGADLSTSLLAKWLREQNHTVSVACSRFTDAPWTENGITVYPIIFNPSARSRSVLSAMMSGISLIALQIKSAVQVLKLIKQLRPDIVNIVPSSYRFVPIIIGIRIFSNCPVVVDCRDYSLVCPAHLSSSYLGTKKDFDEEIQTHHGYRCIGYRSLNDPSFLSIRPFALYESFMFNLYKSSLRFLVNRFDGIRLVTVSKFVQQQLILNGFNAEKTMTIYNISQSFEKRADSTESHILTFAYGGRIETDKGIWDLIDAIEILQRESKQPFAVKIAGTGDELNNVQEYIKEHNLTRVILLGHIKQEEILDLYSDSAAILAPSRWPEPFGRFIQESISVGTPVLATRTGGIPEGIEDGVTGVLIGVGKPEQLAEAMSSFVEHPEQGRRMRDAIIDRQKDYKAELIGTQRLMLYQSLAKTI